MIRPAGPADAANLAQIYNHYIVHTSVTFEERRVSTRQMTGRIARVRASALPWLVLEHDGALCGYCYATPWRSRSAYRYAAEISVYLDPQRRAQGHGSTLYTALFAALRSATYRPTHTVIGGITLPNPASIALHEKFGLRKVAHFAQVGRNSIAGWTLATGRRGSVTLAPVVQHLFAERAIAVAHNDVAGHCLLAIAVETQAGEMNFLVVGV